MGPFLLTLRLQLEKFSALVKKLQQSLDLLKDALGQAGDTEVIHTLLRDSMKVVDEAADAVTEGMNLLKGKDPKDSKKKEAENTQDGTNPSVVKTEPER